MGCCGASHEQPSQLVLESQPILMLSLSPSLVDENLENRISGEEKSYLSTTDDSCEPFMTTGDPAVGIHYSVICVGGSAGVQLLSG